MTSLHEVALLRLVSLGLVGTPAPGPVAAVRALPAAQGQDLPGGVASLALRTVGRSRAEVLEAMGAGTVVRSWPMRGTLHLVAAEDLAWLLAVAGVRAIRLSARRHEELGLDEATVEHAREVAVDALAAAPTDRAGLLAAWQAAGIATDGQRGYHLIVLLAQTGTLCQGPVRGREPLFVLNDTWLPPVPPVDGDEALGALALRYLRGHGPATLADLVRWAGITVRQARTGLALARAQLVSLDVDGVEHWCDPAVPDRLAGCRAQARGVLLLPGFDEYLLGYADRSAALAPEHLQRIVPGMNGVFRPTVVVDGRVVGTWRTATDGTPLVEPFEPLEPEVEAAVRVAHGRLP